MSIGGVVINFTAKTADAVRAVDKLTRELEDTAGASKGATGKIKNLGKIGFGAVAAGAGAAAAFMLSAVDAAAENARSAQVLADVLKRTTGATDEAAAANDAWVESLALATEVADTELRSALGLLLPATKDLTSAQELLTIAVDASVGSGKDLEEIVEALSEAVKGETGALQEQFPWLETSKDGTLTYKDAIEQLTGAYDGAAESAAVANGPMDELQAIFGEMQETLGEALLPKLQDLAEWLQSPEGQAAVDGWIQATADFADSVANLGEELGPAIDLLQGLIDTYNRLPSWMKTNPISGIRQHWENRPWAQPSNPPQFTSPSNPQQDRSVGARGGGAVTINNYYPKPETAGATIARDLRIARNVGV